MTKKEAAIVVFELMANYPNAERVGQATVEAYEKHLLDLDFEPARAAIGRLAESCKFLPSIAEVRAAARDLRMGKQRTGMEAWGDVTYAIRAVGSYRTPTFIDPVVSRVVACMGWQELCLGENESALRARFIEAYEAISDRELREEAVSEPLRLKAPERGVREFNGAAIAGYLMGGAK
jgi:hypothetical protein